MHSPDLPYLTGVPRERCAHSYRLLTSARPDAEHHEGETRQDAWQAERDALALVLQEAQSTEGWMTWLARGLGGIDLAAAWRNPAGELKDLADLVKDGKVGKPEALKLLDQVRSAKNRLRNRMFRLDTELWNNARALLNSDGNIRLGGFGAMWAEGDRSDGAPGSDGGSEAAAIADDGCARRSGDGRHVLHDSATAGRDG